MPFAASPRTHRGEEDGKLLLLAHHLCTVSSPTHVEAGSPGAGGEARLQGEVLSVLAGDTSKENHSLLSGSQGQLFLVIFGDSVS